MINRSSFFIAAIVLMQGLASCGNVRYSLTGGGPIDAKTVVIGYIANKAALVNPALSQVFTEKLKDKFLKESKLELVNEDGDWAFAGYISNYGTAPVSISSDNKAQQTRLTIVVNIKFDNKKEPKKNFDQSFSSYADFDNSKNLSDVENSLIADISTKLVQDIYTKTALDW
jgi:hypothetical protein